MPGGRLASGRDEASCSSFLFAVIVWGQSTAGHREVAHCLVQQVKNFPSLSQLQPQRETVATLSKQSRAVADSVQIETIVFSRFPYRIQLIFFFLWPDYTNEFRQDIEHVCMCDCINYVVLQWALFEVAPNTKAQNKINSINLFYEDL